MSSLSSSQPGVAPREPFHDAMRFWERGRILYTLIIVGIFIAWIALTWPHFRGSSPMQGLIFIAFYTLMANLLYSAAYLVDIPLSPLNTAWHRWRIVLWVLGTLVAVVFTNYWIADEIYPYP